MNDATLGHPVGIFMNLALSLPCASGLKVLQMTQKPVCASQLRYGPQHDNISAIKARLEDYRHTTHLATWESEGRLQHGTPMEKFRD